MDLSGSAQGWADLLEWVHMFLSRSARAGPHHALWICLSRSAVDLHQRIRVFSVDLHERVHTLCCGSTQADLLFLVDPHEQVRTFLCRSAWADLHYFLRIHLSRFALFSADLLEQIHTFCWSGFTLFFVDPPVWVCSIFCGSTLAGPHFFCGPARTVHAGTPCGSVSFLSNTACESAQQLSGTACGSANQGLYFLLVVLPVVIVVVVIV